MTGIKAAQAFLAYAWRVFQPKEMTINAPATRPAPAAEKVKLPIGLVIAVLVMIGILLLPLPAGLPVAGHRMLAIL